jgi:NAD+ diphosphatase
MGEERGLLGNLLLARGVVDRAAEHRSDPAWQDDRRADPRSRLMRVHGGQALTGPAGLHLVPAADAVDETVFLGCDGDDVAYYAEHVSDLARVIAPEGTAWADLRVVGDRLDDRDAGLMVAAVALDNWLRTHRRCPRCGEETVASQAGWSRRCPADESEHFPRTDPAVIVLVRDRTDRALLGRQGRWAPGWFSTLAGFVESGESAESAVRREVHEESGVVVGSGPLDLEYLGSQPWPFPSSLMLGFHAWTDDPVAVPDGDEIAEVRWFSREELAAACASGDVRLPPPVSIARRLVERWYGAPLPGDWSRPLAR